MVRQGHCYFGGDVASVVLTKPFADLGEAVTAILDRQGQTKASPVGEASGWSDADLLASIASVHGSTKPCFGGATWSRTTDLSIIRSPQGHFGAPL